MRRSLSALLSASPSDLLDSSINSDTPVIIVYHKSSKCDYCLDGLTAAWIVARKFPHYQLFGEVYLNDEQYNDPNYRLPFDATDRDVIIVDFCYPARLLHQIADIAKSLTVLDHHKSRMGDFISLSDRILGGCSLADCGATYAWRVFFPNEEQPWFLKHIYNRDTGANGYYEGNVPNSEAVTLYIDDMCFGFKNPSDIFFLVYDRLLTECDEDEIIERGMPLVQERNRLLDLELARYNGTLLDVYGFLVPYYHIHDLQVRRHYSLLGNKAARLHFQYGIPFVAVTTDDPRCTASLSNQLAFKNTLLGLRSFTQNKTAILKAPLPSSNSISFPSNVEVVSWQLTMIVAILTKTILTVKEATLLLLRSL